MSNQFTGSLGEKIATQHLFEKGFRIINRNVRSRLGEIDIIAMYDTTIHFIEVKTRFGDSHGKPYEAINYYKLNHMKKTAQLYVLQNKFGRHKLSLDVVSIILNPDRSVKDIKFFENITM
jgi:putative endonuclease